jgi:hypothetical protein
MLSYWEQLGNKFVLKKKKYELGENMLELNKTINWKILRTHKFKNIKLLILNKHKSSCLRTQILSMPTIGNLIYKKDLKQHSKRLLTNSRILIHSFFKTKLCTLWINKSKE